MYTYNENFDFSCHYHCYCYNYREFSHHSCTTWKKNRSERMRSKDIEKEDFVFYSFLSFFSSFLVLFFFVVISVLCDPIDGYCNDGNASLSDGIMGSTPPHIQIARMFPFGKIVLLILNYYLISNDEFENDFCIFSNHTNELTIKNRSL